MHTTVDTSKEMWYSFASPDNSKEQEENRVYKEKQEKEKARVESIPLESLSFRDLYEFPFTKLNMVLGYMMPRVTLFSNFKAEALGIEKK